MLHALEQHQPIGIVMRQSNSRFLREMVEGIERTIDLPFLGCSSSMRGVYDGIEFTAECVQEPDSEHELTQESQG